jgi:hypothetical protein
MRLHYHIWLIGAICALAVLAVATIFSMLDARDLGGADGALTVPTAALIETAPPDALPATTIGPAGEGQPPAFGRMPAAPQALLRQTHLAWIAQHPRPPGRTPR